MSLAEQIAVALRPLWDRPLRTNGDTLAIDEWLYVERLLSEAGIMARAHERGVTIPPGVDITYDVANCSLLVMPRELGR